MTPARHGHDVVYLSTGLWIVRPKPIQDLLRLPHGEIPTPISVERCIVEEVDVIQPPSYARVHDVVDRRGWTGHRVSVRHGMRIAVVDAVKKRFQPIMDIRCVLPAVLSQIVPEADYVHRYGLDRCACVRYPELRGPVIVRPIRSEIASVLSSTVVTSLVRYVRAQRAACMFAVLSLHRGGEDQG